MNGECVCDCVVLCYIVCDGFLCCLFVCVGKMCYLLFRRDESASYLFDDSSESEFRDDWIKLMDYVYGFYG